MTDSLDIHRASDEERVELFRNVFDVWPMRETLEAHVEARLNSVQHQRANWWVGCADGRVAVSLGCFPLEFRLRGEVVPGFAIGAVHCHADFRGRGFAPRLMAEVERSNAADGAAIGLLYSDIEPDYYARMGYLQCPSWEADLAVDENSLASFDGPSCQVRAAEAADGEIVRALYDEFHEPLPLSIHRGERYWSYLNCKTPGDRTFLLLSDDGEPAGYFRVGLSNGEMILRDYATKDRAEESIGRLFAAVVDVAKRNGATSLLGWVPGESAAVDFLKPVRRAIEITMVKPLRDDLTIASAERDAADWFCEIDHV